jgi:hypothetical protein
MCSHPFLVVSRLKAFFLGFSFVSSSVTFSSGFQISFIHPPTGVADPMILTKYTACQHDKDGKVKYWQGVSKAQEMRHTSPYMHKEEVR